MKPKEDGIAESPFAEKMKNSRNGSESMFEFEHKMLCIHIYNLRGLSVSVCSRVS